MLNLPLLVQICLHLCFPKHGFFLGIIGIIAHECSHFSLIDLNDLGYYTVEEIPVMRYDKYGSLIVHKERLQPGNGTHIQVVRRLVQHNNIRFRKQ
mgnify:CR=1 FL=1